MAALSVIGLLTTGAAMLPWEIHGGASTRPHETAAPASSALGVGGGHAWENRAREGGATRSVTAKKDLGTSGADQCRDARKGYRWYSRWFRTWRERMGATASETGAAVRSAKPAARKTGCPRYLAHVFRSKARAARLGYLRFVEAHTLREHRWWRKDVREAQRVYPGTESWLLSCSAAEGGHGRWVGYGGQDYSSWLRDSDTVGGPMQFRWSTFKGMFRHALSDLRARGFHVPRHLRDASHDRTWRSYLGQALAAGWARFTGNDNSHWSASWGNGC